VDSHQLDLSELSNKSLLHSLANVKAAGEGDSGGTKIRAIASTAAVDRDGESIDPNGWKWSEPLPKLIYGHNYSGFPIGKLTNIEKSNDGLVVEAELADRVSPQAEIAAGLIKGGFLDQGSVGFDPKAWTEADGTKVVRGAGEGWPGVAVGRKYTETDLLEFSVVPVPSNVESTLLSFKALRTSSGRGLFDELVAGFLGDSSKPPAPPTHACMYCDQVMHEDENGWVCRKQTCIAIVFGYQEEKESDAEKLARALSLIKEVQESVNADQ